MKTQSNFPKIPFFLSMLFLCIFLVAYSYSYKAINKNDIETRTKDAAWQKEEQRREEIRQLDNSIRIIAAERALLETHFARSSDVVPFLDTNEELATMVDTKAEVTSLEILKDHTGLLVGMKAEGTFQGLYKFITLLENSQYEIEFVAMDIKRQTELGLLGGKGVINPMWDLVLRIKLLSFVEDGFVPVPVKPAGAANVKQ